MTKREIIEQITDVIDPQLNKRAINYYRLADLLLEIINKQKHIRMRNGLGGLKTKQKT